MNAPVRPDAPCTACATASLPAPGRTDQQQRLGRRGLPCDGIAQRADRGALAEQRALDAAARFAEELLGDAQLALERRRPLRDARFERRVGLLQRLGGAPSLLVEPRVVDRARDLVGDDRHQAALVLAERARHGLSIENTPISSSRMSSGMAIWLSALGRPGTGIGVAELRAAAGLHHLRAAAPRRRRAAARGC